jgi:hypothetical protein
MGAQMNIKNAEAAAIAGKLAALEGKTVTQVVLEALRARERELGQEAKLQRIMELCRDTAARMTNKISSQDIDALLYDEWGLPK